MLSLEFVRTGTLMRAWLRRNLVRALGCAWPAAIAFALGLAVLAGRSAAQEVRFPATHETALVARRYAAGYLRTANSALAGLAVEQLARALQGGPHADLAAQALAAIDAGDLPRAAQLIEQLGDRLAEDRRVAGVRLFADCVREASGAYQALDAYRTKPPDLAAAETRDAVAGAARATDASYARCDSEAPASTKVDPDFRRLMDGARVALAKIPDAVATADGDLLHRLLIELRSFEQLLLFRYG
jgi:hypothetical protein